MKQKRFFLVIIIAGIVLLAVKLLVGWSACDWCGNVCSNNGGCSYLNAAGYCVCNDGARIK